MSLRQPLSFFCNYQLYYGIKCEIFPKTICFYESGILTDTWLLVSFCNVMILQKNFNVCCMKKYILQTSNQCHITTLYWSKYCLHDKEVNSKKNNWSWCVTVLQSESHLMLSINAISSIIVIIFQKPYLLDYQIKNPLDIVINRLTWSHLITLNGFQCYLRTSFRFKLIVAFAFEFLTRT